MEFKMMKLPYGTNDLSPAMSKDTLEHHYGKHYRKYVATLNELVEGTHFENQPLAEVVLETFENDRDIFNNAAQAWNHEFFWNCLTPNRAQPSADLSARINDHFGSWQEFKTQFSESAVKLFGSGWAWLVKKPDGDLAIECLGNAGTPLTQGQVPLLACDVWEHAYYLDYQNKRDKFVNAYWKLIDWNFVEANLKEPAIIASRPKPMGEGIAIHLS